VCVLMVLNGGGTSSARDVVSCLSNSYCTFSSSTTITLFSSPRHLRRRRPSVYIFDGHPVFHLVTVALAFLYLYIYTHTHTLRRSYPSSVCLLVHTHILTYYYVYTVKVPSKYTLPISRRSRRIRRDNNARQV